MAEQQQKRVAPKPVLMEGVRLVFRNFEGKEGPYNPPGAKSTGIILPDQEVDGVPLDRAMLEDGWNVKYLNPSEEEKEEGIEQGPAWIPVKVRYDGGKPPKITMITQRGRTMLDDDTVEMLDWAEITNVDVIIRAFPWGPNAMGASGIAAYVQTMFVTIEEDPLEAKYAEMNEQ